MLQKNVKKDQSAAGAGETYSQEAYLKEMDAKNAKEAGK